MTTALSNVSAIWVDSNAKVGIGFSVVDIGQNTNSRLIKFKANSNTVFDVSVSGVVNANAYFANVVTSNAVKANTTSSLNVVSNLVQTVVYTVPNLPAATIGAGYRSFVSDSNVNTFGSIVFTGGTNAVPVFSDGTYWRVG